jgi:hypothetical protein
MMAFDGYLLVLPSGAGRHGADLDLPRSIAEQRCWQGWLLGCRDHRPANDAPRPRPRVVAVTPVGTVGKPLGTLAAALARAGARHGCTYLLPASDAVANQ